MAFCWGRLPGIWVNRERSATDDICASWENSIDHTNWESLYKLTTYPNIDSFQRVLYDVPEMIGTKAFVANHVVPLLSLKSNSDSVVKHLINIEITRFYIESFLKEFDSVCFSNFFLLGSNSNCILPIGYQLLEGGKA